MKIKLKNKPNLTCTAENYENILIDFCLRMENNVFIIPDVKNFLEIVHTSSLKKAMIMQEYTERDINVFINIYT